MKLNEVAKHLPRLLTVPQFATLLMEMEIVPKDHDFTDKELNELIVRSRVIAMPNMTRLRDHLVLVSNKLAEAGIRDKCVGTNTTLEIGGALSEIILVAEASHDTQWVRVEDDAGKDITEDYIDSMELPAEAIDYIIEALDVNLKRTLNEGSHPLEEEL